MSAAAYIPQRRRYVLMQWHYEKDRWDGGTTWIWRESPTPWGPWKRFATIVHGQATQYYNPCLLAKFIDDDGLTLWVATNGWYRNGQASYSFKAMPVTLRVEGSLSICATVWSSTPVWA